MNKAELIDVLTEKLGSDRRTATEAVEHIVDTIVRAVNKGRERHNHRLRCIRTAQAGSTSGA